MKSFALVGAVLAAAGAAVTLAVPARAQDERHQTADTIILRGDHGPERMMRIMMSRRARLGIKVNLQAKETDSLGAYVDAVTPNGPAAKAGLRSGDIITKLDGQSVLTGGVRQDDETRGQSLSGLRLIELAARLQPNDTVPIEFLRGKDRRTLSVVTQAEPDMFAEGGPGRHFIVGMRGPGERMGPGDFTDHFDFPTPGREFLAGGPLGDLELAPLNPDLGQYFGTNEGILVISVPKNSQLGLKGGDVVVAVDGRKPSSPYHLMRILRSYDKGESFKLDIMRNRKHETVSGKVE
jgi:hypothetical protein